MLRPAVIRALALAVILSALSVSGALARKHVDPVPPGWPKVLIIPKLGVRAPVEALSLRRPADAGAPYRWGDVAWYNLGPRPGDVGRAMIYGHLDSTCCPAVFYGLRLMRKGDLFQVRYKNGHALTFRVQWHAMYWNRQFPYKFYFGRTNQRDISLVTCAGVFHRDGTGYDHKYAVYARLVQ